MDAIQHADAQPLALQDGSSPALPLQSRVEAALRNRFSDAVFHLETSPNGRVHGCVVSAQFGRMDFATADDAVYEPLGVLPRRDQRKVSILVPMTPVEYASWLDDQRYW